MAQVVETLPHRRQGPVYLVQSILWLLMAWRRKGARASTTMVLT